MRTSDWSAPGSASASRRAGNRRSMRSRSAVVGRTAIPAGASDHPLGGLGYANWAYEVADQERELGVFFDTIIVCSVTGSTQAGMIAGFAALADTGGRPRRVIGIDASATPTETRDQVARIARQTAPLIGVDRDLRDDEIVLDERFHAGTYGITGRLDARGHEARRSPRGHDHRPGLRGEVDGRPDRPRGARRDRRRVDPCCSPTSAGSPPSTATARCSPEAAHRPAS
jgi:hypothetical protein